MTAAELQVLDGLKVDVAIIGAGINGASAAQHLSAAGYRVLVVDQGDFADGATSRSSRLLHCGLRHLASGSGFYDTLAHPLRLARSLAVAREDMLARNEIVHTIPERLRAINFCLPIYADDPYTPWQLDAAFAVLRLINPGGVPLDYRRHRADQLGPVPIATWLRDPAKMLGVAVFREYLFDWPERIALDSLFDARRMGAQVHNYTRVDKLERLEPNNRWQLSLSPVEPGEPSAQSITDAKAQVTAGLVLNLAGAWIDEIIRQAGSDIVPKCAGVKGVHIALRLPDEFADWGLFAYNNIGEPLYCLPGHGMHYVGLTRRPYTGDPTEIAATDEEIDWIIAEINRCLPRLAITRADVLFSWAGVNPLTRDPATPLGSREIKIHDLAADGLPGMLALTGGPIMTHRRVARRLLGEVSKRISPSASPQGLNFKLENDMSTQNSSQIASDAFCVSSDAVIRSALDEQAHTLADLLMRRLGAGWASDQGLGLARPVAETAASKLGWSAARIETEIKGYRRLLQDTRRRPGS